MPNISISVKNKIAVQTNRTLYVCGNSDYTALFDLDAEWNAFEIKTARFCYNGHYSDVVFTGNECEIPVIADTNEFEIGLFAGNLHTTKPAMVLCERSILSTSGTPTNPSPDVYHQLIEKINSGMLRGPQGEKGSTGPQGPTGPAGPQGKKGAKGDPGKDAPQIDDGTISRDNPWSSRHIVETLCPPIAESGNPVTCYPVAGYPLGCKVSWEPTQAGEGDPSPDNVRPIKGRDSVVVERCGGNVIEFLSTNDFNSGIKIAVDAEKNITLNGTTVEKSNIVIGMCRLHWVAGKTYTMYVKKVGGSASLGSDDGITFAYSLFTMDYNHYFRGDTNSKNLDAYIASNAAFAETELIFMLQCWRVNTVFNNFKFQIEVIEGTTAPTTYKPYIGSINTLTLPETVYGGEVDAVTGAGNEEWGLATFDGSEAWTIGGLAADKRDWYYVTPKIAGAINSPPKSGNEICSHYPHYDVENNNTGKGCALVWGAFRVRWGDIIPENTDAWKAYLAAQAAAGSPVQIAYRLAEPVAFQATGNGPIMPLDGETNTIMTDADSVAVTGRADPAHAIAALQAQLAVATQALAETQAAVVDTTAAIVDYVFEQDCDAIGGGEDADAE